MWARHENVAGREHGGVVFGCGGPKHPILAIGREVYSQIGRTDLAHDRHQGPRAEAWLTRYFLFCFCVSTRRIRCLQMPAAATRNWGLSGSRLYITQNGLSFPLVAHKSGPLDRRGLIFPGARYHPLNRGIEKRVDLPLPAQCNV